MVDVAQLFGSSDGRFERVFSALASDENTKLEGMQRNLALLSGAKDAVAIVRYTGDHATIAKQLEELTKLAQQHPLEVAMIGGPADARSLLENALALANTKHAIRAYHLPDASPELWRSTSGDTSPLAKVLRAAAEDRLPAPDWPKVQVALESARAAQKEVAQFATALQSRRPYVTYVLLAMIGAMFLLEMSFGDGFNTQTMLALGAIHGELVKSGEYYRMISAGFLHFGPVHLLMNSLVLWRLGGTFERLIGPWRFLILYALALLGGSFGALIFQGDGVSAGASGALWGILGAEAVLAFRPGGVIPASVAQGLKKSAMQNLVLNVVISLTPGIGWAAHFGGGVIGALLTVSGAITAGVKQGRTPIVLKLIGSTCAALMIAGVVIAVSSSGRAELFTKPEWHRVDAPELGISFEVPIGLEKKPLKGAARSALYGDLRRDPVAVAIGTSTIGGDQVTAETMKDGLEEEADAKRSEVEAVRVADRPAVHDRLTYKNGLLRDRWLRLDERALHRVDVFISPDYEAIYGSAAERVIESIKPLP